ncbi:MAG: transporter permease [Hyphomicrobiales bacterium]|nr:transporter permease [Hyphomicrobiales bacterium]
MTAGRLIRTLSRSGFALVLLVILLLLNVWLNPARFAPGAWGTLIGLAAPLIGAALASTPAILSGRGGIDVSIGPLMGFVNAIIIAALIGGLGLSDPWIVIPVAILMGAAIGLFNGVLASYVRIQPIVATLGTYLILTGLTVTIVPAPIGTIPDWLRTFSQGFSFVPPLAIFLIWLGIRQLPYYDQLMATGSDDRAAFTAGVNVPVVRLLSYVLTGIFGGIASLSLSALIGSADPNVGGNYTLLAISATALGGVSLAGGRGGLIGAAIGAIDIFLLQSALTFFNVSTFVLQVAYGAVLVIAVSSTALQERFFARTGK